ncbi:MAG TPA: RNA pyrophosphohydrolase [Pseudomonadales bacterium]
MIDEHGYRANVGIILADGRGRVFWARRVGQDAWQFPQGGMRRNESAEQAMYRELNEEIGLAPADVKIVACTRGWLRYRLPGRMLRHGQEPLCIGQKQRWFLLHYPGDDAAIRLDLHNKPEFDHWQWVSYWYPLDQVVSFKRDVYRRALKELSHAHSQLVRESSC